MSAGQGASPTRRFRPMIPPRTTRDMPHSPSTSMAESPARGPVGGGGVIFRVKRRREEEPLEALLVAERAPKRGAGVSLQVCMDSLSLGSGMSGLCGGSEATGSGAGGPATESGPTGEDTINTSTSSTQMQDSSRRVFKLLGSVPHEMGSSYTYGGAKMHSHDVDASAETVAAASSPPAGGKVCSSHMGPSGSTDKVRELIRRMTEKKDGASRPELTASAQRQKELARIVDLEAEQGEGGGIKFRSTLSPARHLKSEGVGSPIAMAGGDGYSTPADKRRGDESRSQGISALAEGHRSKRAVDAQGDVSSGSILCNGSPLIRETVSPAPSPGRVGDEGMMSEREEDRSDDFVYDYYWIDPDAAAGGAALTEGKVGNVEVDLDELWDDDKLLPEEDWESDQIEESDDSNCENYRHNDYPDEDEEDDLDEEDFDHSLVGGMYEKPLGCRDLSDEDDSDAEEERYRPQNLTRFAFNATETSSDGEEMSSD